jgi:hypothetical protein
MEFQGPGGTVIAPAIHAAALASYSDADLEGMIRLGVRPDGERMSPPMPYSHFALMTDNDLAALILYLRQLPVPPAVE